MSFTDNNLTDAQNELYGWIKNYMKEFQHSPSIRQMMQAMGLNLLLQFKVALGIYKKKDIFHGKKAKQEQCR